MKPNWPALLERALAEAVPFAVRRVYKHRAEPAPSEEVVEALTDAVLGEFFAQLDAVVVFDDPRA
jgi:hypothetical protein